MDKQRSNCDLRNYGEIVATDKATNPNPPDHVTPAMAMNLFARLDRLVNVTIDIDIDICDRRSRRQGVPPSKPTPYSRALRSHGPWRRGRRGDPAASMSIKRCMLVAACTISFF